MRCTDRRLHLALIFQQTGASVPAKQDQNPYPQGGERKPNTEVKPPHNPDPKEDTSHQEGDLGPGKQGLSHGYGGSEGVGTGSSGPDTGPDVKAVSSQVWTASIVHGNRRRKVIHASDPSS
jgi:hypothetical protein